MTSVFKMKKNIQCWLQFVTYCSVNAVMKSNCRQAPDLSSIDSYSTENQIGKDVTHFVIVLKNSVFFVIYNFWKSSVLLQVEYLFTERLSLENIFIWRFKNFIEYFSKGVHSWDKR